jgi:Tol biopolymer transport system component
LDSQTAESLRREAVELLGRLQAGDPQTVLEAEKHSGEKELVAARLLCLRAEHADAAVKLLKGAEPAARVQLSTLVVAQVDNGKLNAGPVLATEIGSIEDIRVSPKGTAIAFTASAGKGAHLSVCAVNGGQVPRVVAPHAAVYPDWSPDGNSLVYIAPASTNATDDLMLAILTRRSVLNERGQVEIQGAKEELAGLMFNDQSRVRCLRDGRILFASEEWRLPVTTNDLPQRQQLFAIDPERQSTLSRLVPRGTEEMLPASLACFEVSPDEKRVAVGGDKSMVAVLTLASGNVEILQAGTDTDLKSIPCWRSATELCYIAVQTAATNQHKADVALWQDGKTRVISQRWPEAVRKGLLD